MENFSIPTLENCYHKNHISVTRTKKKKLNDFLEFFHSFCGNASKNLINGKRLLAHLITFFRIQKTVIFHYLI